MKLVHEEEWLDRAKDLENDLWTDEVQLADDYKKLRGETKEITKDLKRQYNEMETDMMKQI